MLMRLSAFLFSLIILFALGCAPRDGADQAVLIPTLTLIPSSPTPTSPPPTPSPTRSMLPAPGDVRPSAQAPAASPTPARTATGDSLLERDPIAAELVRLTRESVARATDLPVRRVQLVSVEAVVWTDSALNCPQPDATPLPMSIDGYRIRLRVGDRDYVFHTDIDRFIPCDADVSGPPPEATDDPASQG